MRNQQDFRFFFKMAVKPILDQSLYQGHLGGIEPFPGEVEVGTDGVP